MSLSIRKKLIAFYIILIILPLLLINYWSIHNLTETVFYEVETNALKTANIIANLSKDNFQDLVALKRIVKQYLPTDGGRLLILDAQQEVLVDSFNLLEGTIVENDELRAALKNKEKIGYYKTQQRIMQVAVPVARSQEGERQVLGAVILSTIAEQAFLQVEEFRRQLLTISSIALIIGTLVTIVASRRITRPIEHLSSAAKKIGEGRLGEQVDITTSDEIGRLAENFNYMSNALYHIDRGRTQFIGDISHELKTPLASMKALIDSLLYGEEDIAVFKEYLGDMDKEIDRLADLIKALMSLTRLEEQGIEAVAYHLKELVTEVFKILKPLTDKDGIRVDMGLEDQIIIICDVDLVKEVFINLIDNAIKYRDISKNESVITINSRIEKGSLFLSIEDNGIGIAEKDLNAVFDKFYRSDASRSRDTGGAGIGLSIVNRVVKLHGWRIGIESRLGEGTSFIIEIPKESFRLSS